MGPLATERPDLDLRAGQLAKEKKKVNSDIRLNALGWVH